MSPTFDQIVEWLKSIEEGEGLPKPMQTRQVPFPQQFARPAGSYPADASSAIQAFTPPQEGDSSEGPPPAEPGTSAAPGSAQPGAKAAPGPAPASWHPALSDLTGEKLVHGIILSEVLGRPLSQRKRSPPGYRR